MDPSQPAFPPELFDYILDVFQSSRFNVEPPEWDPTCVLALVACARVCRGWLPRSRVRLYACVWIEKSDVALGLIHTLIAQPTLAPLISRVVATPHESRSLSVPWTSDWDKPHYLPLLALLSKLPKIEELLIGPSNWSRHYPLVQTARLGRRTSITHLELHRVHFASPIEFLHLTRSFDALVKLTLFGLFLAQASAPMVAQIQARRPCWASRSLRILDARDTDDHAVPFLRFLGYEIHHLSFRRGVQAGLGSTPPMGPDVGDYIALYPDLQILSFTLVLYRTEHGRGEVELSSDSTSPVDQYNTGLEYAGLHAYLTRILAAVRVHRIHSLSFFLVAFENINRTDQPPVFPSRYFCTRTGFLDAVFDRAVRDIIVDSPMFANLSALTFGVHEDAPDVYSSDWWRMQVQSRLPGLRAGVLNVKLRAFGYSNFQDKDLSPLWEPERSLAASAASEDA